MNDENEDPDWEAEAREGERAEFFTRANAVARRILNSVPLDVNKQQPGRQQFPASEIRLETLEFMDFSPVSATLIC